MAFSSLGYIPADAGSVTAGFCQIFPFAVPAWSPDWDHSHRPGGLLGELATDILLWPALHYGNFPRKNKALQRSGLYLGFIFRLVSLSHVPSYRNGTHQISAHQLLHFVSQTWLHPVLCKYRDRSCSKLLLTFGKVKHKKNEPKANCWLEWYSNLIIF